VSNIVIDVSELEMLVGFVIFYICLPDAAENFREIMVISINRDACIQLCTDLCGFVVCLMSRSLMIQLTAKDAGGNVHS
jgi:hypothetical protein